MVNPTILRGAQSHSPGKTVLGEDALDIIRRPLRGHSLEGDSIPHEASIVGLTMIASSPTTFFRVLLTLQETALC